MLYCYKNFIIFICVNGSNFFIIFLSKIDNVGILSFDISDKVFNSYFR